MGENPFLCPLVFPVEVLSCTYELEKAAASTILEEKRLTGDGPQGTTYFSGGKVEATELLSSGPLDYAKTSDLTSDSSKGPSTPQTPIQ